MTIKTWKERLPNTKAVTASDRRFAMEDEIGDLRANIRKLKKDADQAVKLLSLMFGKYAEGVQCYEEPEDCAGFMGNAVELNGDEFSEIVELLDRLAPRDAS